MKMQGRDMGRTITEPSRNEIVALQLLFITAPEGSKFKPQHNLDEKVVTGFCSTHRKNSDSSPLSLSCLPLLQ